jgi:predicted transcriptional regulator
MKLKEIISLVEGKLLTDHYDENEKIDGAMGADLMSDVLASISPGAALLTGLCNPQVIRTAIIADIHAIIFVRGKQPKEDTIDLANEENISIITTNLGMFEACGILYKAGIKSFEKQSLKDLDT